jgi:DNA replication protein DnaC
MANHTERSYTNIYNSGSSCVQLGDFHNYYGPSPDEQAFRSVLGSLRYERMDDRRDLLNKTFEWALAEGQAEFVTDRIDFGEETLYSKTKTIDMSFTNWLRQEDGGLFCFMGKPGSGKSTLMYVQSDLSRSV